MKLLSYILLVALMIGASTAKLLTVERFSNTIYPICYNKTSDGKQLTLGQELPLPNSIENFISLVEKLENLPSQFSAKALSVIEKLIAWVTINGLKIEQVERTRESRITITPGSEIERTRLLNDYVFEDWNLEENVFNELFTDGEKCSLYYMLSHTVNESSIDPNDCRRDTFQEYSRTRRQAQWNKCPLEQGVVSINSDPKEAVTLHRVLIGIYTSLKTSIREISLRDSKQQPSPENNDLTSFTADPLYFFTIADLLGQAVYAEEKGENSRFGPAGRWNSTQCTTEYRLDNASPHLTTADYKGAADGFILGKYLRELPSETKNSIRLSQILRSYYVTPLPSQAGDTKISSCKRNELFERYFNEDSNLEKHVRLYYELTKAYSGLNFRTNYPDALGDFRRIKGDSQSGDGCEKRTSREEYVCNTPSNVIVLLDEGANLDDQLKAVAELANLMDMEEVGSSFTVLSNRPTASFSLGNLTWNATSNGCPACRIMWYDNSLSTNQLNDAEVLDRLNRTIGDFEIQRMGLSGTGSKVLVYMKYSPPSAQSDHEVNRALNTIRDYHRELRIIGVNGGANTLGFLKRIVQDERRDIVNSGIDVAAQLKKRICEVPAALQYHDCAKRASRGEDLYDYRGFVAPNTIQYWAMHPQYFLKSFTIKFRFFEDIPKSIEVCYSRSSDKRILLRSDNCRRSEDSKPIEFTITNPCKGFKVYNCAQFYFAVRGLDTGRTSGIQGNGAIENPARQICFEPGCKTADQIRFRIKHEGIQCSGAFSLISSPLQLLGTLLALLYIFARQP